MPGHRMPFVIPLDGMIQLQHPSVRFGGPDALAHSDPKTVFLETLCEGGRGFHPREILCGEDLEFPGVCLATMNGHATRKLKEIETELKDALLTDRQIGESKHRDDIMEMFVFRSGHGDPMEARVCDADEGGHLVFPVLNADDVAVDIGEGDRHEQAHRFDLGANKSTTVK
jgi:hypothetical protein